MCALITPESFQANWKLIRKEARRVLAADGGGAAAGGFAVEAAGLHAQRSWSEPRPFIAVHL
jgi:hypothetical protein